MEGPSQDSLVSMIIILCQYDDAVLYNRTLHTHTHTHTLQLPEGVNVSKEARTAVGKAASVFILYATAW